MTLADQFDAVGDQLGEAFGNLDSLVGSLEGVEGLTLTDREAVAGFMLRDDLGTIFDPAELAERLRACYGPPAPEPPEWPPGGTGDSRKRSPLEVGSRQ